MKWKEKIAKESVIKDDGAITLG